jgi:hypothetical protein
VLSLTKDVSAVFIHPDIQFSSNPTPPEPESIHTATNNHNIQYELYRKLSSILVRRGHLLAIDTSNNLDWWADKAMTFPNPVVLVHSLSTGIISSYPKTTSQLLRGIKRNFAHLKEVAQDIPVAVTWDASLNSCLNAGARESDCTPPEQLLMALDDGVTSDASPNRKLNEITEGFGNDVLHELKKSGVSAWFFRTAKIQSPKDLHRRSLVARRITPTVVSGNDFLAMYRHGMFDRKDLMPVHQKEKNRIIPIALGIGALGAGGVAGTLGYVHRDEVEKNVKDVAQQLKAVSDEKVKPAIAEAKERLAPQIEKAKAQLSPHIEMGKSLLSSASDVLPPARLPLLTTPEKPSPEKERSGRIEEIVHSVASRQGGPESLKFAGGILPQDDTSMNLFNDAHALSKAAQNQKHIKEAETPASPAIPKEITNSEPISPDAKQEKDFIPKNIDTQVKRLSRGSVDHKNLPSVDFMIKQWNSPLESSSRQSGEIEIGNRGSVAERVHHLETPNSGSKASSVAGHSLHGSSRSSKIEMVKDFWEGDRKQVRPNQGTPKSVNNPSAAEAERAKAADARTGSSNPTTEEATTKRYGKVFTESEIQILDRLRGLEERIERSPQSAEYQQQHDKPASSIAKPKTSQVF